MFLPPAVDLQMEVLELCPQSGRGNLRHAGIRFEGLVRKWEGPRKNWIFLFLLGVFGGLGRLY